VKSSCNSFFLGALLCCAVLSNGCQSHINKGHKEIPADVHHLAFIQNMTSEYTSFCSDLADVFQHRDQEGLERLTHPLYNAIKFDEFILTKKPVVSLLEYKPDDEKRILKKGRSVGIVCSVKDRILWCEVECFSEGLGKWATGCHVLVHEGNCRIVGWNFNSVFTDEDISYCFDIPRRKRSF
jgi:hypothetical protein